MPELTGKEKMNVATQRLAHNGIATENIWQEFSDRLYGFISGKVEDPEDAKDILQDIFLKIHTKKDTLRDHNKLVVWIYQLTRNAITDYYRQINKRHDNSGLTKPAELPEFDEAKQYNGLIYCLKPFIDKLPDHEKRLINLVGLQGVRQKKIADEAGIPYSTIKTQVQRIRKKLRQMFFDCCDIEFDRRGSIVDAGYQKGACTKC